MIHFLCSDGIVSWVGLKTPRFLVAIRIFTFLVWGSRTKPWFATTTRKGDKPNCDIDFFAPRFWSEEAMTVGFRLVPRGKQKVKMKFLPLKLNKWYEKLPIFERRMKYLLTQNYFFEYPSFNFPGLYFFFGTHIPPWTRLEKPGSMFEVPLGCC